MKSSNRSGPADGPGPGRRNREAWLTEMGHCILPLFRGWDMGRFRVTCGWPSRGGTGRRLILGQCFGAESSKAGFHEIFVSPLIDGSLEAAGTVCHEMAHVAAGVEAQHGPRFMKVCRGVGLTDGKPSTAMPGDALNAVLRRHVLALGEYPHDAIVPRMKLVKPSADVRLGCPGCGCLVVMSGRWFTEVGAPTCACGTKMVVRERRRKAKGTRAEAKGETKGTRAKGAEDH